MVEVDLIGTIVNGSLAGASGAALMGGLLRVFLGREWKAYQALQSEAVRRAEHDALVERLEALKAELQERIAEIEDDRRQHDEKVLLKLDQLSNRISYLNGNLAGRGLVPTPAGPTQEGA